jgi:putative transposase
MSKPRQVIPGTTYMIDRRCLERRYLLLPTPYVTQVFDYCQAYVFQQTNLQLHAHAALSNHYHQQATDRDGRQPEAMQRLNSLLARALNAHWGRWETLWAPGSYSAVPLDTPEDRLDKLIYILANPVAAGLVDHAKRWEGAGSVGWKFGEKRVFRRPSGGFFGRNSSLPEEVSLTLLPPPGFEHLSHEQFDAEVRQRLIARETEIRAQFRAEGRSFLGMDGVLRCSHDDRPSTREPRRGMRPRAAGAETTVRIAAITRWQEFLRSYRLAFARWRDGDRSAVFPEGTWLMRVRHRANCEPFTSPAVGPPAPS